MLLMIDNYDSFTFNLVQYLQVLGAEVEVVRNDALTVEAIARKAPERIVISPGPCTPDEAGVCLELVRTLGPTIPILGVCLGHQAIGVAYGGTVGRAPELLHGKTSQVHHKGVGVLAGQPDPFTATRYHSLTVLPDTVPDEFEVTGETDTGVVMAMRHRELPIEGVQFHPESVLTEGGHRMLANWLASAGFEVPAERVRELEDGMRNLAEAAARP